VDEHVVEGANSKEGFFNEQVEKRAKEALQAEYGRKLADLAEHVFVVRDGAPDVEIIRYAKKNDVDVIVMGALGKSELDRIEHGSTVANVSKYAHCHVIAIRNPVKQFTLPTAVE
jgi:nucleotide-binding universal stress UspA family protein